MSETQLSSSVSASTSEHFNRAAAALKAAERDTKAAIESAADGLASVYGDTRPLLSRATRRTTATTPLASAPPRCASAASRRSNRPAATSATSRSSRC